MKFIILSALIVLSGYAQPSYSRTDEIGTKKVPRKCATAVKLKPKAQKSLDIVLSNGLIPNEQPNEDIEEFLQNFSMETRYVMRTLTGNRCYLGDGHSILRLGILPNLCQDLDVLLQQDVPSKDTLDHAVWMASKLKLKNMISFLIYMGAAADKYKIGD